MKIFAAVFLLMFSGFASATTKADAIQIYNKIVKASGMTRYPQLKFSSDKEINASATSYAITINQGMLNATNRNELALVIGHELGHYKLRHRTSTPSNEYSADALGWNYGVKAGYNMCSARSLFKKFKQYASKTHPHPKDRAKRLPKC